jgi:hypothetical protein
VQVKNRVYYEYYNLENFAEAPEEYKMFLNRLEAIK